MAGEEAPRRYEVTAPAEAAGERVDRVLARALPGLSRSRVKALIESGRLAAGGATIAEPSHRVKPGERLALEVPPAAPARPRAEALALAVVYEDAAVVVVDKPAGMAVHPAPGSPGGTLVNALLAHCGEALAGIGGAGRPGIVHRLDKDTSGLVVAAKTEAAHRALVAQFARRAVERAYTAAVWGLPQPAEGELTGTIGRSPRHRKKMAVVAEGGRPALTRYAVVRPLAAGRAAVLDCRLATGRTHQIRVHLSEAGHPVIGDAVYGRARRGRLQALAPAARTAVEAMGRQALHARRLGFRHPTSGERLVFDSELPRDIRDLIEALESA